MAGPLVIHDLGCGSGAMGRWLAPLLPGPQRWVLHDRDPDLLAVAEANQPGTARDGSAVTVETRLSDVTRFGRSELADATLITASALLDLLTADELGGLVRACVEAEHFVAAHAFGHRSGRGFGGSARLASAASFDAHRVARRPRRPPALGGYRGRRNSIPSAWVR